MEHTVRLRQKQKAEQENIRRTNHAKVNEFVNPIKGIGARESCAMRQCYFVHRLLLIYLFLSIRQMLRLSMHRVCVDATRRITH